MTDSPPPPLPAVCRAHGLHYDPALHTGCVLCRRSIRVARPTENEARARPFVGIAIAASFALAIAALLVIGVRKQRRLEEAAITSERLASLAADDASASPTEDEARAPVPPAPAWSAAQTTTPPRAMPSAYAALPSGQPEDAGAADLARRCDARDAPSCVALAKILVDRAPRDPSRGAALAQRACDLGSADGCFLIADLSARGVGGARDEARALAANARASELLVGASCGDAGNLNACFGMVKVLGNSAERRATALAPDAALAACKGGDAMSCADLARLYSRGGPSVSKDADKAAEFQAEAMALWKRECDRGIGGSCLFVAQSLARGAEPHDFATAATYAKKGCNVAHDPLSCCMLAGMYERGEGVTMDVAHARRCTQACETIEARAGLAPATSPPIPVECP